MIVTEDFDALVIGAGQAGLTTSYYLTQSGIRHVVLERGRIGETWRTQRWRSFRLNTPNWANALPGAPFPGSADTFESTDALVAYFEAYAAQCSLPLRSGVDVRALRSADGGGFEVSTGAGAVMKARHVVIASGIQNVPLVPAISRDLLPPLLQMHSAEYLDPESLPPGAVLVVGGGQTGCQIAEDLVDAGRRVYMATSKVGRAPRRYRGRDLFRWMVDSGFTEVRPADLADPAMMLMRQPQVSGVAGGRTNSYWQLARDGVTLLGHLRGASGTRLEFDNDLAAHLEFADRVSAQLTSMIDAYIERAGIVAPPAEPDPREAVEPTLDQAGPATLDLTEAGITSLIWCTGFGGDFSGLEVPVLDTRGKPLHTDGVADFEGVYFVGFPWLSRRGSGVIAGVSKDAEHIVGVIARRLAV